MKEEMYNRKMESKTFTVNLVLFIAGIVLVSFGIYAFLFPSNSWENSTYVLSFLLIDGVLICAYIAFAGLSSVDRPKHVNKKPRMHQGRTTKKNSTGIAALIIIIIIILPAFGAAIDRIVQLEKENRHQELINEQLRENYENTYTKYYQIMNITNNMSQNHELSGSEYQKDTKIISNYTNLLLTYSTMSSKSAEFKDMSYIYDTVIYYHQQKLLNRQRFFTTTSMMEKNYMYFLKNESKRLSAYSCVYFDDSNLPWVYYPGKGLQFQPVTSLSHLQDLYTKKEYDKLIAGVNEFLCYRTDKTMEKRQCAVWEYNFNYNDDKRGIELGINSPHTWISGMAQGKAIQALGLAYKLTKNTTYLRVAETAMRTLYVNWTKGGVADIHPSHDGYWYLEYAYTNKMRVLNGFMVALIGLHDYYNITNNSDAKFLFSKGINELDAHLKDYDTGSWSAYSLVNRKASVGYHLFHIQLLRTLYGYTGDTILKHYADLFQKYYAQSE